MIRIISQFSDGTTKYVYEGHSSNMVIRYAQFPEIFLNSDEEGQKPGKLIFRHSKELNPKEYCFKIRKDEDFDLGDSGA